jgi:hypothetical protein
MGKPADLAEPRRWQRALLQAVVLSAVTLLSLSLYLTVLWWRGPAATIVTQTAWDLAIPFRPEWVWVYLFPYLIGPLIAALLTRETFWWYIRRGLAVVFISVAIFAVLPTRTVRPPFDDSDNGPTAELYRSTVAIDGPAANAAPSLHVSLTCLLAWALIRDFPRWWTVSLAGVLLVWLSTLLTQQHHLIDVAMGVLLGSALAWPWRLARCKAEDRPKPAAPDG